MKTPDGQLRWMREVAADLGLRITGNTSARVLLRQLCAIHLRMQSLPPLGDEYARMTVRYGKIHDRLRMLRRR